ncbi:DNA methyltransferase [Acidithiobacillus sp. M4-SHS-6]|uniref:DNA methyltransferase n=1 Tax=Acidithiobacillus sp. M4-SHS-6 TaxID=3383024 RepID=UPI0039BE0BDC
MTLTGFTTEVIATGANALPRSSTNVQLEAIDWSFEKRERAHAIEAIHPYPAKFIGEIPRALMRTLPCPKGTLVFDPFAGSGTTLLEAQRLGLPSVGVDLNPIACLIARVKTGARPIDLADKARAISANASRSRSKQTWDIPNVDHWFKADIQGAIAALVNEISTISDLASHDALRLALSSILVRVSNQDSDTRYAAVKKDIARADVFTSFIAAVEKLDKALASRNWDIGPATVIEANTLKVDPEQLGGRVGLVITSPPYPNAYEYWLYHKYRMWWLGFDPLAVKEQEIGARAHFFKRNHHTEENFWNQMRDTFRLINHVLVKRGYACFVIGRSKIHGKIINNADIIQAVAAEFGFGTSARIERTISSVRKSFNLAHANIKTETILVLQKN